MSEISDEYEKLTKHPEGTLRELWHISAPLMLSMLSGNLMLFFDRAILANYATAAMNAAAAAGIVCAFFQAGLIGIASIAEVFVGQFNGSKKYQKIGPAVWQMVYFSIASILILYPISKYAGKTLLPDYHLEDFGLPYFKWVLTFTPLFGIGAALSSFFIGLGKTRLILFTTMAVNVVNILLDFILVFGVGAIIPSMGPKGAAIATGASQAIAVVVYLAVFLNRKNRDQYGTGHLTFDRKLLKKSLRIGVPSSVGHMIEIAAWATSIRIMAMQGEVYLTIAAIGQSLYSLVAFAMEGLQKAVVTIASNFIGKKKWSYVFKTWKSAVKLLFILGAIFSIPLLLNPDPIIDQFLSGDLPAEERLVLLKAMRFSALFVWLYFIVDGLTWTSAGVLTAGGDTRFVMIMNGIGAWFFSLTPLYYLVVVKGAPAWVFWPTACFYGSMNAFFFYLRMRSGKWKENDIHT